MRRTSWAVPVAMLIVALTVLTVLVATGWPPLIAVDGEAVTSLGPWMAVHPALVSVAIVVTDVGSPVSVDVLTGLAVVVLLLRHRPRPAVYLVAVRLGCLAVETVLKHGIGRPRPPVPALTGASGFSFPSGHSAGTAALCVSALFVLVPVVRSRWRAVAVTAAVLLSVAVAASRVVLGVHYPSDVVGGLAVGMLCAVALTPLLDRRGRDTAPARLGCRSYRGGS